MPEDDRAGWVAPWWLERQRDLAGPDFVPARPGREGGGPVNVTHRNWTPLGVLDDPARPVVDPRGLLTPTVGRWSLDWWVGAEDRWHLPSREVAVRQQLVGGAPVVETVMRVPGGDVVHRAYVAAPGADLPWPWSDRPTTGAVIEVENRSAVPVAVALAVRPAGPLGWVPVRSVTTVPVVRSRGAGPDEGPSAHVVLVDGDPALVVARPPAYAAGSDLAGGDCLSSLVAGDAQPFVEFTGVTCPDGAAHAAFVFPLPHTAVLRAVVPLGVAPSGGGGRVAGRRRGPLPGEPAGDERRPTVTSSVAGVPASAVVASGWQRHGERGLRVDVPDERLSSLVASSRQALLLHTAGIDVLDGTGGPAGLVDVVATSAAFDRWGLPDEAERLLDGLADRQAGGGLLDDVGGADVGSAGTAAALWAIAAHRSLGGAGALEPASDLLPFVAAAAKAVSRRLDGTGSSRTWRGRRAASGPSRRELAWGVAGLTAAGVLFGQAARPDALEELVTDLDRARQALAASAAGPTEVPSPDSLDAAALAGEGVAAAVDVARRGVSGPAVVEPAGPAGLSPRGTAWLAVAELAGVVPVGGDATPGGDREVEPDGDPPEVGPSSRLAWLVASASPASRWPTTVHPRTGGGSSGAGCDPVATAAFLLAVRELLTSCRSGQVDVVPVWPDAWWGQPAEAHHVPTPHGSLSWAVRWHGDRPALLWELDDADVPTAPAALTVRAPGLDPAWSTDQRRGEALLSRRPGPGPAPAGSFT